MDNRRKFTRILYAINAHLLIDNVTYNVDIQDISLKGALIKTTDISAIAEHQEGSLIFSVNDQDDVIMSVDVAYAREDHIGLHVKTMDIDSVSIVKRLISLNLGDPEQINKELSQLTSL